MHRREVCHSEYLLVEEQSDRDAHKHIKKAVNCQEEASRVENHVKQASNQNEAYVFYVLVNQSPSLPILESPSKSNCLQMLGIKIQALVKDVLSKLFSE